MKKIVKTVSVLLIMLLMFAALSAQALTTKEKEDLYNQAIDELETYLEEQEEQLEALESLYGVFKDLKGFEKSTGYACYVNILMILATDEIDEFELDFQLSKLKKNTTFTEYLENEHKGSAIGTVEDLENYVNGRRAEANGNEDAGMYYEACLHYFDSEKRYDSLHDTAAEEHYEKAMQLFKDGEFNEAYKEFELAGNYEDSADRRTYLEEKFGFTPSHDHVWNEETCILPRTCSICGETEGTELGHNFDNEGRITKQATCGENGEITYVCKECGATEVKAVPATREHTWNEGVVTSVQTCTSNGKTVYTCLVCGEQKVDEIAKAGEHSWDSGKITKEATCLENGVREYKCTRCGETRKDTIKAYGSHNWDSGTVTKAATCNENGTKTYMCTRCGETKKDTINAYGSHNWDSGTVTKAATCNENGTKTYKCTRCGETRKDTIKAYGSHSWDSGTVTKAATCNENGTKTYMCTRCGETRKDTINATGNHKWVAATTSAPKTCSVCGKTEGNKLTVYYRYRDTTTGYTEWSWSDWSESQKSISDSNLMKEETRSVKKCQWWAAKCTNCGTNNPYHGSDSKCHGCGTVLKNSAGKWYSVNVYTDDWNYSLTSHYGRSGAHQFSQGWFWKTGDTKSVTQYRYATRSAYSQTGSWSSWSTTKPDSISGREIETKTE